MGRPRTTATHRIPLQIALSSRKSSNKRQRTAVPPTLKPRNLLFFRDSRAVLRYTRLDPIMRNAADA